MTKLRLAAIGAGSAPTARSRGFFEVITKLGHMYDFCAICDYEASRAQEAADTFGVEGRYTDIEQMLRSERPDVVMRLTPTDSALPVVVKAAEHGCHVISEIPIALTRPMADLMIEACRSNGVKLEIAENVWLWPEERLKRRIVEAGLLGRLTHARLTYPCGSYHGFNGVRMILAQEPTRVLGFAGVAAVQQQLSYGGEPIESVQWESGVLEFPEGLTCLYELPPKRPVWRRHWEIEGTDGYLSGDELVLYEDGAEVRYPIESMHKEVDGEQVLDCVRVNTDPPVVWENPYAEHRISGTDDIAKAAILESMYRAVTQDVEPAYGAWNARRDQELCLAIRESALRGNVWMDIPLEEGTQIEQRLHEEFRRRYGCDPLADFDAQLELPFTRASVMWTVAGWL